MNSVRCNQIDCGASCNGQLVENWKHWSAVYDTKTHINTLTLKEKYEYHPSPLAVLTGKTASMAMVAKFLKATDISLTVGCGDKFCVMHQQFKIKC